MTERFLEGRRILVLEDEYLAALDVQQMVEELGGTVVGPAGRLEQARELARAHSLQGAICDVKLNGHTSYPLARELLSTGVPVVFLTGYEANSLEPEFRDVPRVTKPYDTRQMQDLLRAVFRAG
ncbi:response regulator [Roseitranquillus sediminis]|uniref:response regulator n=1 Tax=Roseitranquillus sediminis TaxID=2809051 RepID=UPI001D0CACC0|nr:response regulator [Roseitranquillus sediminis]MBM9594650.1 response regulator [Roseitranquillus sediminis]